MRSDSDESFVCDLHPIYSRGQMSEYRVVSFDFFDTLFYRKSLSNLRGWRDISIGFAINRTLAEIASRICTRLHGQNEVTFKDIYRFMLPIWDSNIEIEMELSSLTPILFTKSLFNELVKQGKEVIIISDTHFEPQFIRTCLEKYGFANVPVYTSQEFGKSKTTGLYEHVALERKIEFHNWIHIGDNVKADVMAAQRLGLTAIHLPNIRERLLTSGILSKRAIRYLMRRGIAGREALNYLQKNMESMLDPNKDALIFLLGKWIVGPISSSLAEHAHSFKVENRADTIFYSARDGYYPFLYHKVRYPDDACLYFKTSRKIAQNLLFADYVRAEAGDSKSIVLYDLGWRGTTYLSLAEQVREIQWFPLFAYVRNRRINKTSSIMINNRLEEHAIWRSRDFIEILFLEPHPGWLELNSTLEPQMRMSQAVNATKSMLHSGILKSFEFEGDFLSDRAYALLLYMTVRFPSRLLINAFSDLSHDIDDGVFTPLMTNSWKILFSKSRVMWPYAASLKSGDNLIFTMFFTTLVRLKELSQRTLNFMGRIKSLI